MRPTTPGLRRFAALTALGALVSGVLVPFSFAEDLTFPPTLPNGAKLVTQRSPAFLERPDSVEDEVGVATTPPRIDFFHFTIPSRHIPAIRGRSGATRSRRKGITTRRSATTRVRSETRTCSNSTPRHSRFASSSTSRSADAGSGPSSSRTRRVVLGILRR